MRYLLAVLLVFPVPSMIGCGGNKSVPALTEPGKDPSTEQKKDWMDESKSRGGGASSKNRGGGAPGKSSGTKK